jgi:hypothetical protein
MTRFIANAAVAFLTLASMLVGQTIQVPLQHSPDQSEFVADGNPIPPPPPRSQWMMADGNPIPPPPPKSGTPSLTA